MEHQSRVSHDRQLIFTRNVQIKKIFKEPNPLITIIYICSIIIYLYVYVSSIFLIIL